MENKDNWYVEMPASVKRAFDSRDALRLYNASERTGYFLNDELFGELYAQGEFEAQQNESLISQRLGLEGNVKSVKNVQRKIRIRNPQNDFAYINFLEETGRLGINVDDFCADSSDKKRILRQYFGKFGTDGSQDLNARGYSDMTIGSIFSRMMDYAKERVVASSLAG